MARDTATRERLVEVALRLFREDGFQATTMRRIATEAGVSLGNAYYYFAGKDELVHELYLVVQREHRTRAIPLLRDGASLADNLSAVLHAGLDVMHPYRSFGGTFLQSALPLQSTSSPFSPESSAARDMAVDLMRLTLQKSKQRGPASLESRLPTLLWVAYLGVTLHWVTDGSDDQRRTRALVDGLVPVITKTIGLSRLPVARGLLGDIVGLVDTMTSEKGSGR
ncbi:MULTISPECIES: TetR/AcrR family transcriptional regulator [Nocardiaceae]|uniref:AcrR family transcriptional regulator n=1 Tax=Rhodococcoides corynebacterioides TaxID=53972 RepID=A0ABS2KU27_9NOCA|nr:MULTISPECIES: TetR family transcriptional regulator [Rhodococcus]MBM7415438.1 AcrR family transcriptional regulator [Rhodococcus corynebacterioides]MBP1117900.1 AcrR family transcriptional regulator [Rhodococcus sp. PvP016]